MFQKEFTNSPVADTKEKAFESNDDDEFDDLLVRATKSSTIRPLSKTTDEDREILPNNNVLCKHTCKDKTK